MFKRSAKEAFHWVKDCLSIFRQNPAMWMLVALSYVLLFMVIPAMVFLPVILKLLVVIMGPFFLVLALTLYREAD
jgi:type IV secretory pathway VirB6-like protein